MTRSRADARDDRQAGFTLIELLVVVVIIGILIAIAIPLYLNYRKGANDKAAQSDLRSAISVLEVCNAEAVGYPASITVGTVNGACAGQTINVSAGTTLTYFTGSSADGPGYIVGSTNSKGSGKFYCFNSTRGGAVTQTSTPVTAWRTTAC